MKSWYIELEIFKVHSNFFTDDLKSTLVERDEVIGELRKAEQELTHKQTQLADELERVNEINKKLSEQQLQVLLYLHPIFLVWTRLSK